MEHSDTVPVSIVHSQQTIKHHIISSLVGSSFVFNNHLSLDSQVYVLSDRCLLPVLAVQDVCFETTIRVLQVLIYTLLLGIQIFFH